MPRPAPGVAPARHAAGPVATRGRRMQGPHAARRTCRKPVAWNRAARHGAADVDDQQSLPAHHDRAPRGRVPDRVRHRRGDGLSERRYRAGPERAGPGAADPPRRLRRRQRHQGRGDRAARLSADPGPDLSGTLQPRGGAARLGDGPDAGERRWSPGLRRVRDPAAPGDLREAGGTGADRQPDAGRPAGRGHRGRAQRPRAGTDGHGALDLRRDDRRHRGTGRLSHRRRAIQRPLAVLAQPRRRPRDAAGRRRHGPDGLALHPAAGAGPARADRPQRVARGSRPPAGRRVGTGQRGDPALRLHRQPRSALAAGQHHGLHQRARKRCRACAGAPHGPARGRPERARAEIRGRDRHA